MLSIQEAAEICGKSIQTIRRAIKNRKISAKRKRTPQGFNYMVSRDNIIALYKLDKNLFQHHHEKGSLDVEMGRDPSLTSNKNDYVTKNDLHDVQSRMEELLDEYRKEKENFMRFMKIFQERFLILENQIKLLEAPRQKRWYQFWR